MYFTMKELNEKHQEYIKQQTLKRTQDIEKLNEHVDQKIKKTIPTCFEHLKRHYTKYGTFPTFDSWECGRYINTGEIIGIDNITNLELESLRQKFPTFNIRRHFEYISSAESETDGLQFNIRPEHFLKQ